MLNPINNSFKELQPISIETEPFPRLKKGFTIASFVLGIALFTGGIGSIVGIATTKTAEIGFSMILGGVGGIIAGIIAGIALSFFIKFPTPLEKYQMKTLEQMGPLQTHPKAIIAIQKLKTLFAHGKLPFYYHYEVHDLYGHLATIREQLPANRPDVQKVWEVFLEKLRSTKGIIRDKTEITLDPDIEIKRLKNVNFPLKTSVLNKKSKNILEELQGVEDLEKISFPSNAIFTKESIHQYLQQDACNQCVAVKEEQTKKILGFAWSVKQKEGPIQIAGIARHPSAAHLKIGESLIQELIHQLPKKSLVQLHVQKTNTTAIALYKRFGFEVKKEESNYYGTNDHALLMELNWAVFERMQHAA